MKADFFAILEFTEVAKYRAELVGSAVLNRLLPKVLKNQIKGEHKRVGKTHLQIRSNFDQKILYHFAHCQALECISCTTAKGQISINGVIIVKFTYSVIVSDSRHVWYTVSVSHICIKTALMHRYNKC